MEIQKEQTSDAEDIPSDFFDDFNKDDFMEGLSVVDSWDDKETGTKRRDARINTKAVESVNDLRELIRDGREETKRDGSGRKSPRHSQFAERRSNSSDRLNEYIKPGSRRDPSKTNKAIRKDKEVKVKEYLAKHLNDDLKPPGTELDDFFDETKTMEKNVSISKENIETEGGPVLKHYRSLSREKYRKESPRIIKNYYMRYGYAGRGRGRYSPRRYSPRRHYSPQRRSKRPYSPRRSPRRNSPQKRTHGRNYSRSPHRRSYNYRQSRSLSRERRDTFLYPKDSQSQPNYTLNPYQMGPGQQYAGLTSNEYHSTAAGYSAYTGYGRTFEYGAPQVVNVVPASYDAISLPILQPVSAPADNANPVLTPAMVPAPVQMISPVVPSKSSVIQPKDSTAPYDALAQLVAEGKISKEDYLKLAPNKGPANSTDTKARVTVLNRCHQAMVQLDSLILPNLLVMNNNLIGNEPKSLAPKYCSPLKRQASIDFHFTKSTASVTGQLNKQLVDRIIATIGLDKVIERPKKKALKETKDAAVQTTKAFCDVCEIRKTTKCHEVGTMIDSGHFSSSIHTQVVEHDLINSKAVFNPTGSVTDGAPFSIAHLTPAQLVSQLAARAKTLKQTSDGDSSSQFGRRPPSNYDYDSRGGGNQYHNYNNYRY